MDSKAKRMKVGSSSSSLQQPIIRPCEELLSIKTEVTEDALFEIFLRLPLNSIYKFRCVSKLWLSLLSNPYFITKWMIRINTLSTSSSPWTLLFKFGPNVTKFSTASPTNIHSKFIADHDGFSFRFLQDIEFAFASSSGLVLCSSNKGLRIESYYVCNPLTKKWVSFPAPQKLNKFAIHGFICESFSPTSFKVVRIPEYIRNQSTFEVEIFCSDLGGWNTYQVSCSQHVNWNRFSTHNVVTHNGVFYWFEGSGNRIIAYNLNNITQCRLIDLPKDIRDDDCSRRWLGESEGLLCYCQINKRRLWSLRIWILMEDCFNGGWVRDLVHENIKLKDVPRSLLGINPVDRNILILGNSTNIFAYNIQTETSEVLRFPAYFQANFHYIHYAIPPFVLLPRPTILPPASWSGANKTD